MEYKNPYGVIYLIPTTIGEIGPLEVLPISVKQVIEKVDHYIVENEKSARRFINKIHAKKNQAALQMQLLNKYTHDIEIPDFLTPCLQGFDMGIMSEAGCPGIADPGAAVVKLAHEKNIKIVPLVGPSSIILALMASGLNGQSFAFNGYLPIDRAERRREIKLLEKRSREFQQAQIFIETPYRNETLLDDFKKVLRDQTLLCVACDITLSTAFIKTQAISRWKNTEVFIHKKPCIFIIQPD